VLFDEPWQGYGKSVQYRARGADEAAKRGATACLIRSVTGFSLATPHTGIMHYADRADSAWRGVPRIPAAALTTEDADRLSRLARGGRPLRVHLRLGARTLPDVASANVVGEVRGRDRPDEVVVIGAHLDSWDVGTGAHDDGAGCVIVLEAARLLAHLPSPPRRTVRVVLYQDEENSQTGGKAYAAAHAAELPRHVAALECDSGGFAPVGFSVASDSTALAQVRELARPLAPLGVTGFTLGGCGVDVGFIVRQGVVGLGHHVDGAHYFDYHHSPADTFDKIDARDLARNVAAVAGLAWAVAEAPEPLHRAPPGATPPARPGTHR
jgi:carboxypeptidase Q